MVVLADPAGAEDAVQQVFVRLAGRSPGSLPFEYLLVAVRNECLSVLRRRRRTEPGPLLEPAEGRVCDALERIALERAVRWLPAEQREVVYLRVWAGMSWDEIASVTGVGANTASSRYRYALTRLRRGLTEEENDAV